ncbi:hypothetical protein CEUSTIGMA_g8184.t1 [Chlamydomonas eustigma]|uniref:Right handed beta helix domain-containing protein n=1 Tax=Chlamydomonas eustigma TaxID=1157962 RepID=A0A250XCY6_9CHLO|nr:hypothetical protein CEUSTIGMA_g8184.t1 [Chlamydomonas eustigma]|eukprot:GAX80749.1 hypothetical protein CEUSTIGMA_g8184.t1 [Chlamydomonas eustigma]
MTKGVSTIIKSIISLICFQGMTGVLGQGQADCFWTVSEFAVNGTAIYNSSIDCTGTGVAPSVAAASSSIVEHFVYYTYNGVAELLLNETDYPFEAFSTAKSMITVGFLPNSSGTSLTLKATVSDLTLPYPLNYALIVNSVENFTLKHSTFVNISFSPELFFSAQKGAFFWEDAATQVDPPSISIEDAVFSDIQTSNAVGAVSFPATITSGLGFESSSINILKHPCYCIFSSNSGGMIGSPSVSTQGGALSLGPSCSYHITNCTFKDNKSGGSGGAISLTMNAQAGVFAEMTITDSAFVNNTSGAACGLSGTTCASQVCGGALQISNSSSLVVRSSVFSDNVNAGGGWGGAVCLGRILQGSDQPLGPGEAQACGSSCPNNATFIGTSFHNNAATATASYGGAIMDLASDGLVFDACTFTNNTAGSGAAIYSLWSNSLVIRGGSVFQHNDPNYQYGAVVVSDMITGLNIQGATFSDNACGNSVPAAPAGGGAVYIERQLQQNPNRPNFTVNISDALFEGNSCFNGGAVFIGFASHTVGPNVTFNKNAATTASGIGGALAIQSLTSGLQAPLYSAMTNITFFGNSAPFAGGGLWIEGIWDPHLSSMTFRNNSVSSLTTITIGENAGGGMYVGYLQPINLKLKGLSFMENSAYTGAGLEVFQTNVTLESCSFIGNRAAYAAGGFRSYQLSTFTSLVQVTVVNSNFSENWSGGYGGGLQITKAGIVLYNSTFSDNTASTGGGAVDFEISARNNNDFILYEQPLQNPYTWTNQSVYIMASSFHGNAAGVQGGAIYMDYSSVVISGCSFSSNTAKYLGGAVQASSCINGSVNVYSSSFSGNSASGGTGGALYFSSCNATFNNTNMTGNLGGAAVSGLGGCISTVGVNITVSRGAWTNNKAFSGGGVAACTGGGSVILQAINLLQNNAAFSGHGGVLYMDNAPLALLTNLDVSGCTASSLNNNAAGYGGVVYSSNSRQMTVSNCSFGSNNASGSGGAVYASGTQYLYILLSNITKNGAGSSGGAVFMSSGQLLSIKGVDGSLNSANQSGGVVSVSNTQNVFLEDINTSSSTATQSGGAVSATFVTNLTIDQLTSNNCYTAGSGGAVSNKNNHV